MTDRLTAELVTPAPPVDAASWRSALDEAKATLADLAVRRAGAGPFRVTDYEVRLALGRDPVDPSGSEPFAWSARTARRALGLAAVRSLVGGAARSRSRPSGPVSPNPRAGCATAMRAPPNSTVGWQRCPRRDGPPWEPRR